MQISQQKEVGGDGVASAAGNVERGESVALGRETVVEKVAVHQAKRSKFD